MTGPRTPSELCGTVAYWTPSSSSNTFNNYTKLTLVYQLQLLTWNKLSEVSRICFPETVHMDGFLVSHLFKTSTGACNLTVSSCSVHLGVHQFIQSSSCSMTYLTHTLGSLPSYLISDAFNGLSNLRKVASAKRPTLILNVTFVMRLPSVYQQMLRMNAREETKQPFKTKLFKKPYTWRIDWAIFKCSASK